MIWERKNQVNSREKGCLSSHGKIDKNFANNFLNAIQQKQILYSFKMYKFGATQKRKEVREVSVSSI